MVLSVNVIRLYEHRAFRYLNLNTLMLTSFPNASFAFVPDLNLRRNKYVCSYTTNKLHYTYEYIGFHPPLKLKLNPIQIIREMLQTNRF
jgi:hypothetical protein